MRISIITVCFNSISTIKQTLDSIWGQDFDDIEVIVVDGSSTDGTFEYLFSNRNRINHLVSERDHGVYHAMNKGIKMSTGEIIGIINSDDFLSNDKILRQVYDGFKSNPSIDACFGDIRIIKNLKNNVYKNFRIWKPGSFSKKRFRYGWMMPHPSLFVRRNVYMEFGNFRTDIGTSADYEFMLRCFYFNNLAAVYVPSEFVIMRSGGESSASLKNRVLANKQDSKAWRINGCQTPIFFRLLKPMIKLPQWFSAFLSNIRYTHTKFSFSD